MSRRVATVVAVICCFGVIGVSSASATSEYFYKENYLAEWSSVSGHPRSTLWFVGAYTSSSARYCVGTQQNGRNERCGEGSSVTVSFPVEEATPFLEHTTKAGTVKFTAEERY